MDVHLSARDEMLIELAACRAETTRLRELYAECLLTVSDETNASCAVLARVCNSLEELSAELDQLARRVTLS